MARSKFVNLPQFVKLEKYITKPVLQEIHRLCWLATDDDSPLRDALQDYVPSDNREERIKGIHAIGKIAEEALGRLP